MPWSLHNMACYDHMILPIREELTLKRNGHLSELTLWEENYLQVMKCFNKKLR